MSQFFHDHWAGIIAGLVVIIVCVCTLLSDTGRSDEDDWGDVMSHDSTIEMCRWNADRGRLPDEMYFLSSAKGTLGAIFYDHGEVTDLPYRRYHLSIYDYPCFHSFSVSPALRDALRRVFNES